MSKQSMEITLPPQQDTTPDCVRYIETPSLSAKNTFFYVQETGYQLHPKSYISKREHMNSFLIVYVLDGEGYFSYKTKRMPIKKGACFFIDCMNPYSHESSDNNPLKLVWVHFYGATSQEYYNYFTEIFPNLFYPGDREAIATLLKLIIQNTKQKPAFYEAINSNLICTLLTTLITTVKKQKKQQDKQKPMDEKLNEVYHYLQIHFKEPVSLDALSEKFYISKYYLCREFKRQYGEGINTYINNLRINHAKQLLRFSSQKINQIAETCGITDANYFVKLFKSSEGMTPSEYRKQWTT